MATIDDAILAAVQGAGTPAEKLKIISELRKSLPTDRWTFRWVIWGLIVVVLIPVAGVFLVWLIRGNIDVNSIPQGLISLASTALGALAAFITPGSHQLNPQREAIDQRRRLEARNGQHRSWA